MIGDPIDVPFDPPNVDLTYAHYLKTCAMLGVVPVSREHAQGLIQECNEVCRVARSRRSSSAVHQTARASVQATGANLTSNYPWRPAGPDPLLSSDEAGSGL